ncbi:helix-turn-helix domain-containing protein [Nocardia mexicana]|uniref:Helix-turn-helix protein n=1 Tax=Nocardia mexicana TaxID=279262 RepID=A0A370H9I0_9NOCA|nr:helix-turn-helix transcriptional regulator [Nocardia mexicana]RDI53327.1 helix-turn-helix protein [Nocardia mexicana]
MQLTTGEVIRRIRKSLGMTQTELGGILGYTQPVISQLEHDGAAIHDVRVLRRIAKALHVPLAILVVESDEEADVNRRNFLRASTFGAGTAMATAAVQQAEGTTATIWVDAGDVAEINATVNQVHELDLVVGGDRLCRLAAGYVQHVQHLLDTARYSDDIGRQLTSAAAEMMTAAGWVHYDAGRPEAARRYYADAAQAASAADDGFAAAHALGNASGYMVNRVWGRDNAASDQLGVQYAQAASRAALPQGGPKLRALMALREAEAHGGRGDKAEMAKAISRAYRAYESARGFDPEWVYLPEAEISGIIGKAHMWLGDYETAVTHLGEAAERSAAWPRERASWQLHQAHNLIHSGEFGQACSLLTENFDAISDRDSARLQQRFDALADLVRPHARVPEVRDFLGKVAEKV